MADKTAPGSQNSDQFPEIKPTKPTDDTAYISPIIGKLGYDTERPWLFGLGTSPNNGVDFHVFLSFDGLNFDESDVNKLFQVGASDRVKKMVDSATAEIPQAVSNANEAVKKADSAVSVSKVNSDAIAAMQSAEAAAKSSADQAMSDAQAAIKNVASDAAAIRQHVSDVESAMSADQQANSSATQQLRDDLSTAKQNIATATDNLTKAQSAIDDNKQAIASNAAAIEAAITQHKKDIEAAQAANAQTTQALAAYTKQAEEQGKTITTLEKDQDDVKQTIADVKGNVSQIEQSVTTLQGALKDTQGNVATVKAQADSLQTTLTDYQKSVTSLTATATALQASMKDADGRLSTVEQTASEQSTTISDLKDGLSKVTQEADSLTATLKDAQGDISQTQATAKSLSTQIESAQGDITSLTKTATSIQASLSDHDKRIASVEARADKLESDMKDAQGNITTAVQTASAASVTASDAKSDIAEAVVAANSVKAMASDANSNATEAKLTASNAAVVASDAKSDVMTVTTTASEAKVAATNARSQALDAKAAASEVSVTLSGVERTATDAASEASAANSAAGKAQNTADQANSNASDAKSAASSNADVITTVQTSLKATQKELTGKVDQSTVDDVNKTVSDLSGQVTVLAGQAKLAAKQTDVDDLKKTATKQEGEIQANANGLLQKADKSQLDTLTKAYNEQSAQQQVLADQIKNAVTEATMKDYVTGQGYATQSVVQSIVDQKADTISETITSLDKKVGDNADAMDKKIQEITASVDGVQSTVKNKADQSTVTQLSDLFQVKLGSVTIAVNNDEQVLQYHDWDNEYQAVAELKDPQSVQKGAELYLTIELTAEKDCKASIQLDEAPWTPFGDAVDLKARQKQTIIKQFDVTDDSWTTTKATHLCIRSDNNDGKITVSNVDLFRTGDVQTAINAMNGDINMRVQKGDLISQINLEAGQTLIQSKKIFLDADTVAFSGKAFIPSAAITSLDADKITAGYLKVPMSDGNGNTVQVSNNGVDILSNNKDTKLFNANRGIASVHIDAAGMGFGATTNGAYEQLGALSVLLDDSDGISEGTDNLNGIGFVVETQQQYGSPYGGDFFSLARSIKGPPSYYNGFLYEATGSGKHEIGSHFFDPVYFHPFGADNYIKSTWVSWTGWDNGEKYPAFVQSGPMEGGIAFPKSGKVTLFDAAGHYFTPTQWGGTYTGYQHEGPNNNYSDPNVL